jgi:uncharacterized protein (UPF0548 family)
MADDGLGDPPFTYTEIGATRSNEGPPLGYREVLVRRRVGSGRALFERAAADVMAYRMQKGTGILLEAGTPTAEPGTVLTFRLLGVTQPTRIAYVLDEPDRRGFAVGTLPGSPEIGEELFAVEYDPADDSVYGLIKSFSRPATWWVRLAGPAHRALQRKYGRKYIDTLPTSV